MCLQTFHGVEKTPLFYYNNQHQEKRFGGSKKGIRFSKKFFETHRKPHGYWVPVISVTKDKNTNYPFWVIGIFLCAEDGVEVYPRQGKSIFPHQNRQVSKETCRFYFFTLPSLPALSFRNLPIQGIGNREYA